MKTILFVILLFVAVTATPSGIAMIARPGGELLRLPNNMLEPTLFRSFLLPGIILFLVGLVNVLALIAHIRKARYRYNWAIAAGVTTFCWIIGQIILLNKLHWLHIVFLFAGAFITLIAWQLKGKWAV